MPSAVSALASATYGGRFDQLMRALEQKEEGKDSAAAAAASGEGATPFGTMTTSDNNMWDERLAKVAQSAAAQETSVAEVAKAAAPSPSHSPASHLKIHKSQLHHSHLPPGERKPKSPISKVGEMALSPPRPQPLRGMKAKVWWREHGILQRSELATEPQSLSGTLDLLQTLLSHLRLLGPTTTTTMTCNSTQRTTTTTTTTTTTLPLSAAPSSSSATSSSSLSSYPRSSLQEAATEGAALVSAGRNGVKDGSNGDGDENVNAKEGRRSSSPPPPSVPLSELLQRFSRLLNTESRLLPHAQRKQQSKKGGRGREDGLKKRKRKKRGDGYNYDGADDDKDEDDGLHDDDDDKNHGGQLTGRGELRVNDTADILLSLIMKSGRDDKPKSKGKEGARSASSSSSVRAYSRPYQSPLKAGEEREREEEEELRQRMSVMQGGGGRGGEALAGDGYLEIIKKRNFRRKAGRIKDTTRRFSVVSPFQPTQEQQKAINLLDGLLSNDTRRFAVLKGATGTGKTFIMANLVEKMQMPTLLLAPNKVLAAQLYNEFKTLFPKNKVEYFVSYYDYYRPESYRAVGDVYSDKVAKINQQIDRMRHSATRSLFERSDTLVVSSVSCIYGLGMPAEYLQNAFRVHIGARVSPVSLCEQLSSIRYEDTPPFEPIERGGFRFLLGANSSGIRYVGSARSWLSHNQNSSIFLEIWPAYETRILTMELAPLTPLPCNDVTSKNSSGYRMEGGESIHGMKAVDKRTFFGSDEKKAEAVGEERFQDLDGAAQRLSSSSSTTAAEPSLSTPNETTLLSPPPPPQPTHTIISMKFSPPPLKGDSSSSSSSSFNATAVTNLPTPPHANSTRSDDRARMAVETKRKGGKEEEEEEEEEHQPGHTLILKDGEVEEEGEEGTDDEQQQQQQQQQQPLKHRQQQRSQAVSNFVIYPASHHIVTKEEKERVIRHIREELDIRLGELRAYGKEMEAKRLAFRTEANLEALETLGYCKGVENYARHLAGRNPGEPPETLLDYFPYDGQWMLMVDESHVSLPQIRGMFRGDVKRKLSLVRHGFRLPSALDNRPLQEDEFWARVPQAVLVSATPGPLEQHLAHEAININNFMKRHANKESSSQPNDKSSNNAENIDDNTTIVQGGMGKGNSSNRGRNSVNSSLSNGASRDGCCSSISSSSSSNLTTTSIAAKHPPPQPPLPRVGSRIHAEIEGQWRIAKVVGVRRKATRMIMKKKKKKKKKKNEEEEEEEEEGGKEAAASPFKGGGDSEAQAILRVRHGRKIVALPFPSNDVRVVAGSNELMRSDDSYNNQNASSVPLHAHTGIVELLTRPTGILDPSVLVRPTFGQMDDLLSELYGRIRAGHRALVVALTRVSAEKLSNFLNNRGVRAIWMHCDVKPIQRLRILAALRRGVFDVVVGVNLLREGLDLPEVSLVAIMDADKEGFLRSESSLIQIIGRAARHINGTVIMYANTMTGSMKAAIKETNRRRKIQEATNVRNGHQPAPLAKKAGNVLLDTIAIENDREKEANALKSQTSKNSSSSSSGSVYGFKDASAANKTIAFVEENKPDRSRSLIIAMLLRRALRHPYQTEGMRDAAKVFQRYLELRRTLREQRKHEQRAKLLEAKQERVRQRQTSKLVRLRADKNRKNSSRTTNSTVQKASRRHSNVSQT